MAPRKATSLTVRSFPPVAGDDARVLILGSMPGQASLAAGQYYAHPRNQFWTILGRLLGFDPALPYTERLRSLKTAGIAVWDVLAACERPGSMDASIDRRSIVVNDFATFFARHTAITDVFFNGTTAASCFRREVMPLVAGHGLYYRCLPSTSPAHASLRLAQKIDAWQVVAQVLSGRG